MDQELKTYLDAKFADIDGRFESIDGRFESIDGRFESIDGRFESNDERFATLESAIKALADGQARLEKRFDALTDERREDLNRQTQLLLEGFQAKVEAVAEGHDVIRSELDRKFERVQGRRRDDLATVGTTLAALQKQV